MLGEEALWSLEAQLQALTVDTLNMANWQRGGKGRRPKPLPRPGVGGGIRIGRIDDRDPDEVRAYLDRFKPQEPATVQTDQTAYTDGGE